MDESYIDKKVENNINFSNFKVRIYT